MLDSSNVYSDNVASQVLLETCVLLHAVGSRPRAQECMFCLKNNYCIFSSKQTRQSCLHISPSCSLSSSCIYPWFLGPVAILTGWVKWHSRWKRLVSDSVQTYTESFSVKLCSALRTKSWLESETCPGPFQGYVHPSDWETAAWLEFYSPLFKEERIGNEEEISTVCICSIFVCEIMWTYWSCT